MFIYVSVFNAMYGFVVHSCEHVFALVFSLWLVVVLFPVDIKLTAYVCMAGWILETEWSDFFSCLCWKLLISYHSIDATILWLYHSLGLF